MPLYVKDQTVDDLATQLQAMMGIKHKGDAVRIALTNEIERCQNKVPLREKIAAIQKQRREETGSHPVNFDMKAFSDEGWDS